ncbi:MAG: Rid family hydrolase [Thermoanaerobaculia bacterium]|jgi:2-aminophenol/2-amino-5-chlorophenol 1,6-dioxygenase alpha subunit
MTLIQKAYIVPGLPHIYLAADRNKGWASLRDNYLRIATEIEQSDAELMLVYSTQWFSVIGHLFQVDPKPAWTLVDANWYEYGEIPYELRVDAEFGRRYCETARRFGLQASTVNYKGFPVDSGTVVAMKFLNPDNRIPASVVSCNIYAERDETRVLGRAARVALEEHGKKAIVVVVSNFSNRFHTHEIDPAADAISSAKDDEWNRKLLEILADGRLEDTAQLARQFAREANADMGFKAIWWLSALLGETNQFTGRVWDYQPVWGTGAALVELTPATEPRVFEKEYDEVSISELGGAGDATSRTGTGLASHNLLEAEGDGQSANRAREGEPAAASTKVTTTSTDKAPKPVGAYPHAKRVGDMLFLSGIGPRQAGSDEIPGITRDEKGEIVDWDIEVQTRAVIENVKTILREAGSSLDKVVDVTVFLTNMKRDFAGYNKVYAEYFSSIQATRTTVGVDSLPTPIAVEFKILAMP